MAKNNRHVVIDASVARAAGDTSMHPVSRQCRDTLQAFSKTQMTVATCSELVVEWRKHQSNFSRLWLLSMVARGRFLCLSAMPRRNDLRVAIATHAGDQESAEAMEKDAHLLELALETGQRIIALDEVARLLYRQLAQRHHPIRDVYWANPTVTADETIEWIARSSPDVKRLTLGFSP